MYRFWLVAALGLAMLLQGCAGGQPRPDAAGADAAEEAAADEAGAEQARAGAEAGSAEVGSGPDASPLEDPESPLANRVFYFPFDSSQLSAEDREVLKAHAAYLAEHPDTAVVVEGHADERGSREYNLALGERRAQAVEKLLLLQGVARDQLQVISFGEERPVALGHDESAWSLNRRVELLYSGY